jgi:hypothetical protein
MWSKFQATPRKEKNIIVIFTKDLRYLVLLPSCKILILQIAWVRKNFIKAIWSKIQAIVIIIYVLKVR